MHTRCLGFGKVWLALRLSHFLQQLMRPALACNDKEGVSVAGRGVAWHALGRNPSKAPTQTLSPVFLLVRRLTGPYSLGLGTSPHPTLNPSPLAPSWTTSYSRCPTRWRGCPSWSCCRPWPASYTATRTEVSWYGMGAGWRREGTATVRDHTRGCGFIGKCGNAPGFRRVRRYLNCALCPSTVAVPCMQGAALSLLAEPRWGTILSESMGEGGDDKVRRWRDV